MPTLPPQRYRDLEAFVSGPGFRGRTFTMSHDDVAELVRYVEGLRLLSLAWPGTLSGITAELARLATAPELGRDPVAIVRWLVDQELGCRAISKEGAA